MTSSTVPDWTRSTIVWKALLRFVSWRIRGATPLVRVNERQGHQKQEHRQCDAQTHHQHPRSHSLSHHKFRRRQPALLAVLEFELV